MLEEGAEALLAEGDEATLGLYRDHLRGEGCVVDRAGWVVSVFGRAS